MGITFLSTDDPAAGMLEPVLLEFERHHPFDGPRKKAARCRVCKRGQHWIEHLGFPEPLDSDSGTDPLKWQTQKRMWQEVFGEALHHSGLPRGVVESVQVSARYVFERRVRRDRDNLIYPLLKFLGDTLVRGRYWTLPYEAIDWSDAGMVPSEATGRPLKFHRRLHDPGKWAMTEADAMAVYAYGRRDAILEGRTFKKGEPVPVRDPLGGWIPDDRWDRFDVIDMQAVYVKDREALEIMVAPSTVPPGEWPPELTEG